jgi:hypothetical protein
MTSGKFKQPFGAAPAGAADRKCSGHPSLRLLQRAQRGSPVDAPRSQVERGAAQSGHAAQDGREEGQQGCPGAPSGKIAAAGARSPGFGRGRGPRATGLCCGVRVTIGVSFFLAG